MDRRARPRWLVAASLSLLVGCGEPRPTAFDDCGDLDCRVEAVEGEWRADPTAAAARVSELTDELERIALVSHLTETFPGQTDSLCALLDAGPSRDRCSKLNRRPHLFATAPRLERAVVGERPGGGPTSATLPVVDLPRDWGEPSVDDPCGTAQDRGLCITAAASRAAEALEPKRAWALCQLSESPAIADDCTFQAAEAGVTAAGHGGYVAAATLCDVAGTFTSMCQAHLLSAMNRTAVAPGGMDIDDARDAIAGANVVLQTWTPVNATVARMYVDRYWAEYFSSAYVGGGDATGDPLDVFPPEAHPHIRAALAVLLQKRGKLVGALSERTATLAAALDSRSSGPVLPSHPTSLEKTKNLWHGDDGASRSRRAVYLQGPARRPLGEDLPEDLALCVLEAAAQAEPADVAVLQQTSRSADPLLAWSAARLLSELESRPSRGARRERPNTSPGTPTRTGSR